MRKAMKAGDSVSHEVEGISVFGVAFGSYRPLDRTINANQARPHRDRNGKFIGIEFDAK